MRLFTWFIIMLMFLICFYAGRIYEAHKVNNELKQNIKENTEKRKKFHGANVIWEERGRRYFVRKAEDHKDRKKWITFR